MMQLLLPRYRWRLELQRLLLLAMALVTIAAAPEPAAPLADRSSAGRSGAETVVLGPLDQIEVFIDNYPDLKTTTRVNSDGAVILPLVGPVRIAGMTPADAANEIETHYVNGGFIKLPTIRIEILDYQSRKASVLGQVNNQGLIALDRAYSVAEIIARAGGLAGDAADLAVVVRPKAGGGSERLTIDLGQMSDNGSSSMMAVRAGDVIFVPKAPTFSVVGAINRAGTYPLKTGMTVEQALAAAGDTTAYGSRSRLRVRRIPEGGQVAVTSNIGPDDSVKPGDVITVRERLF